MKSRNFVAVSVSILLSLLMLSTAKAEEPITKTADSPKETYFKYRAALSAASKIDDVSSFLCKRVNEEIQKTPAPMKPMMFGLMKEITPKKVDVVSDVVNGDNATLTLTGKDELLAKVDPNAKEVSKGTVTLVKENGIWKIDKESWETKIKSGSDTSIDSK